MLSAHVLERPEPPSKRRPGIPPALSDLVMRCLEKDKEDRWQTAEEMLPPLESRWAHRAAASRRPTRARLPAAPTPEVAPRSAGSLRPWPALAAIALGRGSCWAGAAGAAPDRSSQIAVLPFQDLSGKDQVVRGRACTTR